MKTIKLTDSEYKLLLFLLAEVGENRGDMGCNDEYEKERKLFTLEEYEKMKNLVMKNYSGLSKEDKKDFQLSNFDYPEYLLKTITNQTKKSMK